MIMNKIKYGIDYYHKFNFIDGEIDKIIICYMIYFTKKGKINLLKKF